jgi:uncharacterized membrane protein
VGTSDDITLGKDAFPWDATSGMVGLGFLTGGNRSEALGVSADGSTVVGFGTNPSGEQEAWIAIIPEPSTALLVGLGLVGIAAGRRRTATRFH